MLLAVSQCCHKKMYAIKSLKKKSISFIKARNANLFVETGPTLKVELVNVFVPSYIQEFDSNLQWKMLNMITMGQR